ncbi:hypothetical protein BDZ89DRAFT_1077084 [Hymenopellis radicata]|nr:hypothetical protein BDZ89DRAFT_1077084 [Hymenopellis radicata]
MGGDHKCPVCQATFTRPQHVARHMRSHTGDRPYKCTHCGDQFARSDLLSRHINKCHANEKDKLPAAANGRRKGSSTRATTSKQACDQCVQGSLPCDGCNPCAKCVQRKVRCTFVKFHRQTAPVGPGHNPRPTANVIASSSLSQMPMAPREWGGQFSFPQGSSYPSDLDDYAAKYRYQAQELSQGMHGDNRWMYQPATGADILGVGPLSRHPSLGHAPSQQHHQQQNDFYGYRPESSGSGSSASSSAASSSVHLPLDSYITNVQQPAHAHPAPNGEGGFSSAFGLMSLDDPAVLAGFATDGQPFFDSISQLPPINSSNSQQPSGHIPANHPYQTYQAQSVGVVREEEVRELREFWKEYMRTPLTGNMANAHSEQPTPHRRQRVSSLPSVKTPTENIYGNGRTMHDADDLRSYEAAVLARKAPIHLSMNSGLKGRRERSATGAQNPDRPSFKRLPSQKLRGGSEPEPGWTSDWGIKAED